MAVMAASGDTWGISGPQFLVIYAVLAGVSVLVAVLFSQRAARGEPPRSSPGILPPPDAAYLGGGAERAVAASLAALRVAGVAGTDGRNRLTVTGPPPAEATPLDRAVHHAMSDGGHTNWRIRRHRSVTTELDRIERRLVDARLLLPRTPGAGPGTRRCGCCRCWRSAWCAPSPA